jgi:Membrane proteins related to metalloendopeptidases
MHFFGKSTAGKRASALILSVVSIAIIVGFAFSAMNFHAGATDATVKKYRDDLAAVEAKRKSALLELQNLKNSKEDERKEKEVLDQLVMTTQKKLDLLNEQQLSIENEIAAKNEAIAQAEIDLANREAEFRERLVIAYEEGSADYLEIILGSVSLSDFFTRIDQINTMFEYDKNLMAQYEKEKVTLAETIDSLKVQETELEKMVIEAEGTFRELEARQGESEKFMLKLQEDVDKWSALEAQWENDAAQIDGELSNYLAKIQRELALKNQQEAARKISSFGGNSTIEIKQYTSASGAYMWPTSTTNSKISSYFGPRSLGGARENHGAIDIPAAYGASIFAANAGTVLIAEYHYSYGNYVLVDHGGGMSTLYAHMSSILVSVGDSVSKGGTIGRVGSTGYSTGNHLHFEVRVNGTRVDPQGYVAP